MRKQLLITIATIAASLIAWNAQCADETTKAGQEQVPVFLSGVILKGSEVSTCNQANVKYAILHYDINAGANVTNRLAAANKQTDEYLKKVAGTRMRVAVAGYFKGGVEGPQCAYVDAYYAGPEKDLIHQLEK